jgi:formamidopyrimidine-DNA glycosylase
MPELPDIVTYIDALKERVLDQPLKNVRIASPFLLRSFDPPLSAVFGQRVIDVRRMGKRIVFCFEDDLFMVLHLMIAGRLRWREPGAKLNAKIGLATFEFPSGVLLLTEASSKKRASLTIVRGEEALAALNPGGLEVLDCTLDQFSAALKAENHTI